MAITIGLNYGPNTLVQNIIYALPQSNVVHVAQNLAASFDMANDTSFTNFRTENGAQFDTGRTFIRCTTAGNTPVYLSRGA